MNIIIIFMRTKCMFSIHSNVINVIVRYVDSKNIEL